MEKKSLFQSTSSGALEHAFHPLAYAEDANGGWLTDDPLCSRPLLEPPVALE